MTLKSIKLVEKDMVALIHLFTILYSGRDFMLSLVCCWLLGRLFWDKPEYDHFSISQPTDTRVITTRFGQQLPFTC
jgi:hypothetical protein